MIWLVVLVLLVVVVLVIRSGNKREIKQQTKVVDDLDQLNSVRRAVDEDITALAFDLQILDNEIAGKELDELATADYRRVLDAYDAAKESLAAVNSAAEITNVTAILDEGRYAIACVRARVNGEPLPPRRPPCFFNPAHGPSVRDVEWAPAGGVKRDVPACVLDAERVAAGADPDTRKVLLGTQRVPYWEAGRAYGPFTVGYFGFANAFFAGTMMSAVLGGWDGSYGAGYDDGQQDASSSDGGSDGSDGGGFDGGGSDGGGFDGGGFDGGGFDGGGFDGGGF